MRRRSLTAADTAAAEEKKPDIVRGRPVKVWKLIPDRRNEGLDLTVYAMAAMYAMGPAWLQGIADLASERTTAPPAPDPEPAGVTVPSDFVHPLRGGFVNSWRR